MPSRKRARLGLAPASLLACARAKQRPDVRVKRRIVVVECSSEGAEAPTHKIEQKLVLEGHQVVLRELESPTRKIEELIPDADVIATSFFHVEELRELLPMTEDKLVALSVKPHLHSLVEIAGIPSGASVLLVCLTESGAEHTKRSLEGAGITPPAGSRVMHWEMGVVG